MAKHFELTITDTSLAVTRNTAAITREAVLDGFYVLRTKMSVPRCSTPRPDGVLRPTTALAGVERAFRSLKTVDLEIRPIHHRLADRVRAHVFLCMLAYYVIWHIRTGLGRSYCSMITTAPPLRPPDPHRSLLPKSRLPAQTKAARKAHRRWPPGAQFPQPARRPGHPLRQPDPTRRRHARIHHAHQPHSTAASLRTPRPLPPPRPGVVSTTAPPQRKTPAQRPNPSPHQGELRAPALGSRPVAWSSACGPERAAYADAGDGVRAWAALLPCPAVLAGSDDSSHDRSAW